MPEMEYNSDDLRTGAKHASSAADSAGQAASTLKGSQGGGSPFGAVTGADALHGAVGSAQQHHSVNAQTAGENLDAASVRASGTADLGDDNTAETTELAPRTEQANHVAQGM